MTETFYHVLGVSPDATTEEIRAAYRERLKESHPDLSDDEDANATTKRIIRARDVLTDPDERERYDRIGHEAYVGQSDGAVDDGTADGVSDAAAAARERDWASDDGSGEDRSDSSRGGKRRARERRRRERAASERVAGATDRGRADGRSHGGQTGSETRETGREAAASADGGSAAGGRHRDTAGTGQSWNGGQGYSVRQERDDGLHRSRLFPAGQSLSLLGMTFILYPVLVFSMVFPPFQLFVNVVVGVCTIAVVGYLQSIPEVGVVVFGVWSLVTPVAFVFFGVELLSLVGLVALTSTWLPLGLSVLTLSVMRP